ncbi:SDR family NAD(P)-dependent oxidoreductase [Methylobacterium sp. PvR107]|uniref:SDR family NAD(P)-dependent oxidoreductase n=1 Tax=Methylobacterium sp. PvR107 TaxID=2806597 RepID=UPI001AE56692|nr:SDR family NAD(P)-dependent oxidoreductase [Methylobacterium sp. PvR107]MBP1181762.1 NAD(P)-dependent dehydrogenase (short-subunit alcohol dehydrogenase family) [Methylobacterium sp. PvR107]
MSAAATAPVPARDLEGRVAVVLGAGSIGAGWGIGRAIGLLYARAGAHVVAADRDRSSAEETRDLILGDGGSAEAVGVDVADDAGLAACLTAAGAARGGIDILYFNVGIGKAGPSTETSAADWRRIADANLTALHVAATTVLPGMRARRRGVILATSSIAGLREVGYPHLAYGATKAALIQYLRLLAVENAPHGIRANTIVPGLIDTPRIEQTVANAYAGGLARMKALRASQCPLGRMGTAFDVAEAALFLASDRAAYVTGTELLVDGGLAATARGPSLG